MTRYVLAAHLHLDGYSPRGTTMVAEHGTAAIREKIARALHDLTKGLIVLSESGMTGDTAHLGNTPAWSTAIRATRQRSNRTTIASTTHLARYLGRRDEAWRRGPSSLPGSWTTTPKFSQPIVNCLLRRPRCSSLRSWN